MAAVASEAARLELDVDVGGSCINCTYASYFRILFLWLVMLCPVVLSVVQVFPSL
jgi:hypothetical protein